MPIINGLARLRDKAARLNKVTEAATRALDVTETILIQNGVGGSARVPFGGEFILAFGRWHDGGYRLSIDQLGKERPWQEWPRQVKIQAAACLQQLIDQLHQEIDSEIKQVDDDAITAIARVNKFIDEMEGRDEK